MDWEGVPDSIEDYAGFVYLITNVLTGKKYIGKKIFWSKRKLKPLKGKKRKRIVKKESDWKTYYGSSNSLTIDVDQYGTSNFRRQIIFVGRTRWDCSYEEARLQFKHEVLISDDYYNGIISCRLRGKKR